MGCNKKKYDGEKQRGEKKERKSQRLFFFPQSFSNPSLPSSSSVSPRNNSSSLFKQKTMAQQAEKGTFAVKVRGSVLVSFV